MGVFKVILESRNMPGLKRTKKYDHNMFGTKEPKIGNGIYKVKPIKKKINTTPG